MSVSLMPLTSPGPDCLVSSCEARLSEIQEQFSKEGACMVGTYNIMVKHKHLDTTALFSMERNSGCDRNY